MGIKTNKGGTNARRLQETMAIGKANGAVVILQQAQQAAQPKNGTSRDGNKQRAPTIAMLGTTEVNHKGRLVSGDGMTEMNVTTKAKHGAGHIIQDGMKIAGKHRRGTGADGVAMLALDGMIGMKIRVITNQP